MSTSITELENVCEKLDEKAVKYFEILEELTDRKKRLEDGMREGFFNLSKARYSMGSRSVGSLQYNTTDTKALASVQVREEDGTCSFCTFRQVPGSKVVTHQQEGSVSGDSATQETQSNENQVRRRKGEEKELDKVMLVEQIQDLTLDTDDNCTFQDPLKWFGILVPAALRQGQAAFIQAVDQCVEIASLQNKLIATHQGYKELLKQKLRLKGEDNGSIPQTEETDGDEGGKTG